VRLSTSTLYEALARLLEPGWIERVDGEREKRSHGWGTAPSKPIFSAAHGQKTGFRRPEQFG
jgi:hypothetical protein